MSVKLRDLLVGKDYFVVYHDDENDDDDNFDDDDGDNDAEDNNRDQLVRKRNCEERLRSWITMTMTMVMTTR